ncbi:MAG: hypothetical protein KFF73_08350 [Cyclobacteriaceae bacterium]|nr:hypothetical protein [Cyclobacteriaceae bacterium]
MEELIKAAKKLQVVQDQIQARQSQWKDLKNLLKEDLQVIGEESGMDFEVQVTDHIENWESVSFKLKDQDFSYYVKGNKKQVIVKSGGYMVFGLMPSGFIKIGMVFPKINDIKEKEVSFKEFDLVKDLKKIGRESLIHHFTRFIREVTAWELGEFEDLKERIGFKVNK